MLRSICLALLLVALSACAPPEGGRGTPSPTASEVVAAAAAPSPTPAPSLTASPRPAPEPAPSVVTSPTPDASPSASPTAEASTSPTVAATAAPSVAAVATVSPTAAPAGTARPAATPPTPTPAPEVTCPGATTRYAICGQVTARDTGAPVPGARAYLTIQGADEKHLGTTDADGRYTMSLSRAGRYYSVYVSPDTSTRLAAVHYGDVACGFETPAIDVQRHVGGIDLKLPPGHFITTGVRTSSGTPTQMIMDLMVYLPQSDRWCGVHGSDRRSYDPTSFFETAFYAEGTYHLRASGSGQVDANGLWSYSDHPYTWYPSSLTGVSSTPIVLDRDLIGADAKVITLPARILSISGTVWMREWGNTVVQAVTLDRGRVEIVAEGYPQDWNTGAYSLKVPPGTYRVRVSAAGLAPFYYHPGGVTSYDAATPVVVTGADVTGINIIK